MIKYSVIIPVYNVEKYLKQCVNSILAQTEKDFEMILVDDGSTDNSGRICDEYADADDKISVIHQKNGGLSAARNSGINIAVGEYLVFLDADDYLDIGALEHLSRVIGTHNYDVIVNRADRYDEKEERIYPCSYLLDEGSFKKHSPIQLYQELLHQKTFTFTAWIFVVSRSFLLDKELFFYPGLLHEDELWTPYLMLQAKKIGCNNNHFYYYRVNRNQSIMAGRNIEKAFSLVFIMNQLLSDGMGEKYGYEERCVLNRRASDIYLSLLYILSEYRDQDRYKELKEQIKGKQKILLYRETNRERLIKTCISCFGLECFLIFVGIKKYISGLSTHFDK